MTDNEIIKALEYCVDPNTTCHNCVLHNENDLVSDIGDCARRLKKQTLDLINRQKVEIKGLRDEIEHLHEVIDDLYEAIEGWDI